MAAAGRSGQKRAAVVVGPSGEEESKQLAAWRESGKRSGDGGHTAALPASLKRGRVDREKPVGSEVVRRERPQEVSINIQTAAGLDPDRRVKWLSLALEAVAAGAERPSDLFDVLGHARFERGVSAAVARRMLDEVRKRADLFPEKLREAILSDSVLGIAKIASSVAASLQAASADGAAAQDMLRRCADFVRINETRLEAIHKLDTQTFQMELRRDGIQQVWGLTWSRTAFAQKRRILEGIVAGTPAGMWNEEQIALGNRPLHVGDELIAVGGRRGFQGMGVIRDLLEAPLTFVKVQVEAPRPKPKEAECGSEAEIPQKGLLPPAFELGGYSSDAGDGWRGHRGGQWLHSEAEGVYFHTPSGALFVKEPSAPSGFARLASSSTPSAPSAAGGGTTAAAVAEALSAGLGDEGREGVPRLLGRVRWFSRAKGFGFVAPWAGDGEDGGPSGGKEEHAAQDLFLHRSQVLEGLTESGLSELPAPLLPGTPVTYVPVMEDDGKACAKQVCCLEDLTCLCQVGFSTGSSARPIEKAAVELKAHGGISAVAAFAGLAAGRRGVGGAEYVALNSARDLVVCFRGREQGGERGARAAFAAALRQTQHGFCQYAQRLNENSASAWLNSETVACSALVFAPEADGRPRVLVASVGGGRAVVGRRDGSVASRLGWGMAGGGGGGSSGSTTEGAGPSSSKVDGPSSGGGGSSGSGSGAGEAKKKAFDFDKGFKGPAIAFPQMYNTRESVKANPRGRGFGGHAASQKDGGAVGLEFDIHSHALDWEEDALLILGSESFWACFPREEEAVRIALHGCRQRPGPTAGERAAELLMDFARLYRQRGSQGSAMHEDAAVVVLRFAWSALGVAVEGDAAGGAFAAAAAAAVAAAKASEAAEVGGTLGPHPGGIWCRRRRRHVRRRWRDVCSCGLGTGTGGALAGCCRPRRQRLGRKRRRPGKGQRGREAEEAGGGGGSGRGGGGPGGRPAARRRPHRFCRRAGTRSFRLCGRG
mmetsp:Transcript_50105/g.162195  ORF Transcript_50105/g.162195 Transcript_50105/m.162195 type:complete len:994 (-) Transcript_50105:79-3060(-)